MFLLFVILTICQAITCLFIFLFIFVTFVPLKNNQMKKNQIRFDHCDSNHPSQLTRNCRKRLT